MVLKSRGLATLVAAVGLVVMVTFSTSARARASAGATSVFAFATAAALPTSDGGTEPRYTVTPGGKHYAISNTNGTAEVWESDNGITGWHVAGAIANQSVPSIDVDLVSMASGPHRGRLIAVELDFEGINFRISYSDDGGKSWTPSNTSLLGQLIPLPGGELGDQDRPWLATGPGDRAYLLFHNLVSGTVNHNMYVATSSDGGASFGTPIPVTTPGTQAYLDLQCADSGGPSNIFVNPRDGRVYAVWGTRSSPAGGGCGASITGNFEVNVVAAARVWLSTAPAAGTQNPAAWQQSLAVDDNASGHIVGMQLAPGAIDSANNVYILYPESPGQYPNYDGAAIKYVHALQEDILENPYGTFGPARQVWSKPVVVAPAGGAGNLLPHIVAGNKGGIDMAYFHGVEIPNANPPTTASWYLVVAQTTDALDASPVIRHVTITYPGSSASPRPAYSGFTASQMMGACTNNGVQNGFLCSRSTDVWGVALDTQGRFQVAWPVAPAKSFGCSDCNDTWTVAQVSGPTIAPPSPLSSGS